MERRHENALNELLEAAAFEGYACMSKWRVVRWYGQSNFSVNIRRDLRERWKTLIKDELGWDKVPVLKLAEISGTIFLMKDGDFFPDKE
jgi:hypothetical protein